jgi:hypothetical protein
VTLVADTVDVDAVGLDQLDDADSSRSFVAIVFNVVVIVLPSVSKLCLDIYM